MAQTAATQSVQTPSSAQIDLAGAGAANQTTVGDIVVTSRKRSELLLNAPLSITALPATKLTQLDLTNLTDISKITPGFRFEQQSFNNGFRLLSQIRFRGMVSLSPRPNNQVGAVFVDGAYVAAGGATLNTDDVERIEVIKGPQNAYFGRNTFAGAVNFITRPPSDTFGATAKAEYKSFNGYDLGGSVEGPLLKDVLSARLIVDGYQNGTGYASGDGLSDVGRQKTTSGSLVLKFTPGDRFKMVVRAHLQHDEDYGNLIENYSGNLANCKVGSIAFFCGQIPKNGDRYTAYNGQSVTLSDALIFQDTHLNAPALVQAGRPNALIDQVNNTFGALNDVSFRNQVPKMTHFGSTTDSFRITSTYDYDLSHGFSLSGNIGYGEERSNSLRDDDSCLDVCAGRTLAQTTFLETPFWARDFTGEARVTSPRDQRLRGMVGISYYQQWLDGNISGSGKQLNAGTGAITVFSNNDRDRSYAVGLFSSLSYDILSNLTLDVEARYQDEEARQFTQAAPASLTSPGVFNPVYTSYPEFLPRVILTWKPKPTTTLYASFSQGALSGVANVSTNNQVVRIAAYPANPFGTTDPKAISAALARTLGYGGVIPATLGAERTNNYEIGYKQSFLGGRGALTVAAYHIDWTNMKESAALVLPYTCDGISTTCSISATLPANSHIDGAEFQLDLEPVRGLALSMNGEVVSQKFTNDELYGVAASIISTAPQVSGNGTTLIQYPTYTLFNSARYSHQLAGPYAGYLGGEYILTGKQYLDEGNQSWIGAFGTVNLRAGVSREHMNLEVFVTNLLEYTGPVGGRRNTLGDGTVGLTLYPAAKRTFGLRLAANF